MRQWGWIKFPKNNLNMRAVVAMVMIKVLLLTKVILLKVKVVLYRMMISQASKIKAPQILIAAIQVKVSLFHNRMRCYRPAKMVRVKLGSFNEGVLLRFF